MRPAELRDPHGLSHQLGAMAMDTAPLFPFPTGFVSHKTMPTENHLPGPSEAHGMVSLVNTVLWNPGTLREHADGAARSAALCEVSSRHWQALLAAGDGDCVARTVDVVLWFIFELMAHEVGHHLFKRLVRACGEAQLGRVVGAVAASPGELVASAMQLDGRRSVKKLLVAVRQQGRMLQRLTEALSVGVAELMMDSCGHTLVETCLNRLNPEQNRFIFTAAMANLKKLAKTKHGSPSVIKCIEHAPSPAREVLVNAVISASACLSQDPRGNYVVQRVIELEDEEYTGRLCRGLSSHWVQLAMHKNGSHVLECGVRSPAARRRIAEALMSSGKLDQIARDPYGNYVVQRMLEALKISEPELHEELVRSLQPHLQSLRYHPHGGKVLELLIQLKSPTPP